ncbi:Uncharacterized protein SCG7109_BA_00040 [Chlamydiales bacterium SCGC AG-110-M15]|nr:Uncharacterized protein SCG7109_BA_00040 [Chlamydiales bacterium SCGC AG-110-M15]
MQVSFFIAQALGLYLSIICIAILINPMEFRRKALALAKDESMVFSLSFLTLILGILMVISHNIWVFDWRALVSLLCWSTLIKGITFLMFPAELANWAECIYKKVNLSILAIVYLAFGLFLCWKGFF